MGMQMDRVRGFGGGAVLAALVAGGLTVGAVTGAAPAQASCVSIFGLGNGNGCTSTQATYAIGIGSGAQASATGLFGGALAIGNNATATMTPVGLSAFNFATAIGDNAYAQGFVSLFGIALQFGPGTAATLGVADIAVGVNQGLGNQAAVTGIGGIAIQLGRGSANNIGAFSIAMSVGGGTETGGIGDLALNLFGNSVARVSGSLSAAVNFLGSDNVVAVGGGSPVSSVLNLAVATFGRGNTVAAGPGPLAFAGSILQSGATVTRAGTGFNINGLAFPGEASAPRRAATSAAASSVATSTAAASSIDTSAAASAQRPTAKAESSRSPRKNTR
jgi:hypothetical protein